MSRASNVAGLAERFNVEAHVTRARFDGVAVLAVGDENSDIAFGNRPRSTARSVYEGVVIIVKLHNMVAIADAIDLCDSWNWQSGAVLRRKSNTVGSRRT
jgi:hypothetical protein